MSGPLQALKSGAGLRAELVKRANRDADRYLAKLVREARADGATLRQCAEALGLTRQALHELERRTRP